MLTTVASGIELLIRLYFRAKLNALEVCSALKTANVRNTQKRSSFSSPVSSTRVRLMGLNRTTCVPFSPLRT